jgi:hypothetical protein
VTVTGPALAIALAATGAVSVVAFTYLVVSAVDPNQTTAPETKPVPLTVRVNPAPPSLAELGLKLLIAGAAVTVNVLPFVEA